MPPPVAATMFCRLEWIQAPVEPGLLYERPFTDFHHNGVEGVFDPPDVVRLVQILRDLEAKTAA